MTTASPAAAPAFPLHLGSPADFGQVRTLLRRARFDEAALSDGLKLPSLAQVGLVRREELARFSRDNPSLAVLVRLLVIGEAVSGGEVERLVHPDLLQSLTVLDVLRRDRADAYAASVMLYPVGEMLIASDRHDNADGSPFVAPPDVVFPAIFTGTYRFLRVIAKSPADDALDLCSGTGIGAFVLSRSVRRVVASDLTARCTHMARFNRLLNDCQGVEVVQGDLYEPVAGRQFDRIVAHPPYVPALSDSQIFRDGGDTGESILRRIVAGLPQHLRPGGTFYCMSAGWDTADAPFEQRVRGWLGEHSRDFDLILAHDEELSPQAVARRLSEKALGGDGVSRERFEERFAQAALEKNVYGALVLRRVRGGAGTDRVTLRCRLSERTDGGALDAALAWQRWRTEQQAAGTLEAALLGATLRLGSDLNVKTLHVVEDGQLAQDSIVLESDRPFLSSTKVEPWMMALVAEFAGGRKAAEVYAQARQKGAVPQEFGAGDFAQLVAAMVERGYLGLRSD